MLRFSSRGGNADDEGVQAGDELEHIPGHGDGYCMERSHLAAAGEGGGGKWSDQGTLGLGA